jgi:hypothetical protein
MSIDWLHGGWVDLGMGINCIAWMRYGISIAFGWVWFVCIAT